MRSSPSRTSESPDDDRSSKKPRRDDTVVPRSPAESDENGHDELALSLFPPPHNINLPQEETAVTETVTVTAPHSINLPQEETAEMETVTASIAPPFPQPPLSYTAMFLPNISMPLQHPGSYPIQFGLDLSPSSATAAVIPSPKPPRPRKNATQKPKKEGKSATVPAPFLWARDSRATVYSMQDLISKNIYTIEGKVKCKRCEEEDEVSYNLTEKFYEVWKFVVDNRRSLNDRAPAVWMTPTLPTCRYCHQENSARPVIPLKKREINWLFLLLGQMLGCCTLEQLKYFCKHTKNHRTGAKDRLLYLTYLGLCKQLDPSGPFNHPWT